MFGLLGKTLSHSLSPQIHALLGDDQYQLWEVDDLSSFLSRTDYSGFNVTIPYKESIIPYLDGLDGIAKSIGAVNTVVKKDGQLIGYNTDYYGLFKTIQKNKVVIKNKNILIVGNGGASKTAKVLMKNMGAASITIACRTKKQSDEVLFSELPSQMNTHVLINTTSIGMYPHNDDPYPLSLDTMPELTTVIDLIYNPLRTSLLLEAEKRNITAINGLYMLVMQAKASRELFLDDSNIDHNKAVSIYHYLFEKQCNVVFIGMPLSGKTAYAKQLSSLVSKPLIDTDSTIEQEEQTSIPDLFEQKGELYFRNCESSLIERIYKRSSLIVSTGGGMVMDSSIVNRLKQNGILIYLDKDYHEIMRKDIHNRPLIKSSGDVELLAKKRIPYYQSAADITIKTQPNRKMVLEEIEAKLYAYYHS